MINEVSTMRILFVEDDAAIAAGLTYSLSSFERKRQKAFIYRLSGVFSV